MNKDDNSTEIEEYISQFDIQIQQRLTELRTLVQNNVPEAYGKIAYGMIAYHYSGKPLVYFGGFKNHIGLYALPTSHKEFAKKLSAFKQGKGSVQFPHSQKIPMNIIKEMLEFRIAEINNSSIKK